MKHVKADYLQRIGFFMTLPEFQLPDAAHCVILHYHTVTEAPKIPDALCVNTLFLVI